MRLSPQRLAVLPPPALNRQSSPRLGTCARDRHWLHREIIGHGGTWNTGRLRCRYTSHLTRSQLHISSYSRSTPTRGRTFIPVSYAPFPNHVSRIRIIDITLDLNPPTSRFYAIRLNCRSGICVTPDRVEARKRDQGAST